MKKNQVRRFFGFKLLRYNFVNLRQPIKIHVPAAETIYIYILVVCSVVIVYSLQNIHVY